MNALLSYICSVAVCGVTGIVENSKRTIGKAAVREQTNCVANDLMEKGPLACALSQHSQTAELRPNVASYVTRVWNMTNFK